MYAEYSNRAVKELDKMPDSTRRRIISGIDGLMCDPPVGDIKFLRGYTDGSRRLRIGNYRVIYKYYVTVNNKGEEEKYIHIAAIGVRGDVYK